MTIEDLLGTWSLTMESCVQKQRENLEVGYFRSDLEDIIN